MAYERMYVTLGWLELFHLTAYMLQVVFVWN